MKTFFGLVFIALIVAPVAMLGAYALTPWEPVRPEAGFALGLVLFFMGYGGLMLYGFTDE